MRRCGEKRKSGDKGRQSRKVRNLKKFRDCFKVFWFQFLYLNAIIILSSRLHGRGGVEGGLRGHEIRGEEVETWKAQAELQSQKPVGLLQYLKDLWMRIIYLRGYQEVRGYKVGIRDLACWPKMAFFSFILAGWGGKGWMRGEGV